MPDSGPAEPLAPSPGAPAGRETAGGEGGGEALGELEEAVDRLVEAYADLRTRVERAEEARRELADTLAEAGSEEEVGPEDAERRFRELSEENRRLRSVVEEGRERAERIRSRLMMMEDEL